MSIEDDLETDVASLRRELLDWILTEIRGGRQRGTLGGTPLAQDLVDVVRGGLQVAVDQAIRRVEEARLDGVVEALNPTFGELSQGLRGLQASLQASIATELSERSADADARFASLERSIVEVQRALGAVAERRTAASRTADRTDEILREIRKLGASPEGAARTERVPTRPSAPESSTPAPTWPTVAAIVAGAALVAALAGWFAHGGGPPPLTPESDVADQARQLQASLSDLASTGPTAGSATAPKVDPQTIAGDVADVAAAVEQAASATTPEDLRKAHQAANDAIAQLRGVLAFDSTPKPTAPTQPSPAQPAPTPPPPHVVHAAPAPHHATTNGHPPASPAPAGPAPTGGLPPSTGPNPPATAGAGGGH